MLASLVLAALAAFVWSLSAGALPVSTTDLFNAFSGGAGGMESDIVRTLRLPRATAAFACGGLLALADTPAGELPYGTQRRIEIALQRLGRVAAEIDQHAEELLGVGVDLEGVVAEIAGLRADVGAVASFVGYVRADKLAGDTEIPQGQMIGGQFVPPAWTQMLAKALNPLPAKRQEVISEFIHDLTAPGAQFHQQRTTPLIERNPVLFWKCSTALLTLAVLTLLALRILEH